MGRDPLLLFELHQVLVEGNALTVHSLGVEARHVDGDDGLVPLVPLENDVLSFLPCFNGL